VKSETSRLPPIQIRIRGKSLSKVLKIRLTQNWVQGEKGQQKPFVIQCKCRSRLYLLLEMQVFSNTQAAWCVSVVALSTFKPSLWFLKILLGLLSRLSATNSALPWSQD
jgi:hypothetical protein